MTKIQILSNTNFQLEQIIKNELVESENVRIAVAFLKKTGLDLVKKQLDYALQQGTQIEFIVGLDFKTTDYKALNELENIKNLYSNFHYYCFGDKKDNYNSLIFHPKIYLFNSITKYTSIVGSSNFTGGGLTTNFEVNTIFHETRNNYKYFSQLYAIYKEIKFQDSIFIPDKTYLENYSKTRKEVEKFGEKILNNPSIKKEIKNLEKSSLELEGTIPSLKKMVIDAIKLNLKKGIKYTSLNEIYAYIENFIEKNGLNDKYKIKTLKNSIRGEINTHEETSNHKNNLYLFSRSKEKRGFYTLTKNGLNYKKR